MEKKSKLSCKKTKRRTLIIVFTCIVLIGIFITLAMTNKVYAYMINTADYFSDDYWNWHVRTTTNDMAYNGKHIVINENIIHFYGYGIVSHKDFLYKEYERAGEKVFKFQLDETKGNYHTLDGAGFIFNSKEEDGKLSGYILLFNETKISIYRLDDVDMKTFENSPNTTVANYASGLVVEVDKPNTKIHNLIIKATPTRIIVNDNDIQVIDMKLDYLKHEGENFGLIVSYLQHNCSILTQIDFLDFGLEINDYKIPVLNLDKYGNKLEGSVFRVLDEEGNVVRGGITNKEGIFNIVGLQEGVYSIKQVRPPNGYIRNEFIVKFRVTEEGKTVDINTGEEIAIVYVNERMIAKSAIIKNYETETVEPIEGTSVALCDQNGNILLDSSGKEIIVTTNQNGEADFTKIVQLDIGKYYYRETNVDSQYILNDSINTFEVNENGETFFKDNNNIAVIFNDKEKTYNDNISLPSEENSENINEQKSEISKKTTGILPKAGESKMIIIMIIATIVLSLVVYLLYRKNK